MDDLRAEIARIGALRRSDAPCSRCGHSPGMHVCHFTYTRCVMGRCNCDMWTALEAEG